VPTPPATLDAVVRELVAAEVARVCAELLAEVRQVLAEVPTSKPAAVPACSPADLLTTEEVAELARVSTGTVREWIAPPRRQRDDRPRPPKLPARKVGDGRRWVVLRADLDAFLRGRQTDPEEVEARADRLVAERLARGSPR
jgi:hypothetical protein